MFSDVIRTRIAAEPADHARERRLLDPAGVET
jgi:hypothetical protein